MCNKKTVFFLFLLLTGSILPLQGVHYRIIVFIHGTIHCGLSLLSPRQAWHDAFTGSTWFERTLRFSRTNGYAEKSDLMLDLGLVEVTPLIKKDSLEAPCCHKAAIHIIRAFDRMHQAHTPEDVHERRYYTFGWSGLMSEKNREFSARQLYHELSNLRRIYTENQTNTVSFELHAHSHGGQLVLHLAQIKKEYQDQDFIVDWAILSAVPLYYQKVKNVLSGTFNTILNIHSDGDRIQTADFITTPERRCYRRFKEVGMPLPSGNSKGPLIADVRLLNNHQHNVFGHASFFILDRYYLPSYLRNRRKIRATIDYFDPLPLIVLYPVMIPKLIAQAQETGPHGYQYFDINFFEQKSELKACLSHYKTSQYTSHHTYFSFPSVLETMQQEVLQAYANTSFISEFDKIKVGIKHAFTTAGKKGRRLYGLPNS